MNALTPKPVDLTNEKRYARNSFTVALVAGISTLFSAFFYLYLAQSLNAGEEIWQAYMAVLVQLLIVGISIVSMWQCRRGQYKQGMIYLFVGLMILIPVMSTLVAGVGLILALTFLVSSIMIVGITIPGQAGNRIILGAVVSGIISLGIDLYWTSFNLWPRLQLAQTGNFIPVISAAVSLVILIYVAWQFRHFSLRAKFVTTLILVAVFPLVVLGTINVLVSSQILTQNANDALNVTAQNVAEEVDTFINTNLDAVRVEARFPAFVAYLSIDERLLSRSKIFREQAQDVLQTLGNKRQPHISSYGLLNVDGVNVLDTNPASIGISEADQAYFQVPLTTGNPYVSPVQASHFTQREATLYFSAPVLDEQDKVVGVLRVRFNARVLQDLIADTKDLLGKGSFAVLFDEYHLHLAHALNPEANYLPITRLSPDVEQTLRDADRLLNLPDDELYIMQLDTLEANLSNVDAVPNFLVEDAATGDTINQVAVARMENAPWLVAFFQPQDQFLTTISDQIRGTIFFVVLIAAIVAGIAFWLGQVLAQPIVELTASARQVSAGDFNITVPVKSHDETGQLAEAFNAMTAELRNTVSGLEDQIKARTAELTLSMEVGQQAASIRELDVLLPTIVNFIRERFNLYYVQTYFVDDVRSSLVLVAGTGDVGRQLLAQQHTVPINKQSIVGRVAAEVRAIAVPDTEASDFHKANPLLPLTRSEMAVPLLVEDKVIGVLDMQAQQTYTFDETNIAVFEAMGTQLAISIDSAQQWAAAQTAQKRAEEAIRQLTQQTWQEEGANLRARGAMGYAYNLFQVTPLEQNNEAEQTETDGGNGISVPLQIQNQKIGQFSVKKHSNRKLTEDEQIILDSVADQLSQKLENLRLFESAQRRASREELTRQITDHIRASSSIESALKTAAAELSKALDIDRAVIELNVETLES